MTRNTYRVFFQNGKPRLHHHTDIPSLMGYLVEEKKIRPASITAVSLLFANAPEKENQEHDFYFRYQGKEEDVYRVTKQGSQGIVRWGQEKEVSYRWETVQQYINEGSWIKL